MTKINDGGVTDAGLGLTLHTPPVPWLESAVLLRVTSTQFATVTPDAGLAA